MDKAGIEWEKLRKKYMTTESTTESNKIECQVITLNRIVDWQEKGIISELQCYMMICDLVSTEPDPSEIIEITKQTNRSAPVL